MSTDLARSRVAFLQSCLVAIREAQSLPPSQALHPSHTLAPNWYLGYGNTPSLTLKADSSFVTAPSFSTTPYTLCSLPLNRTAALAINGPYAHFFVHDPRDEAGFGGSTFTVLTSDGTSRSFRGPWSSRVSAISTHFPTSPALCECSLNCCSALTLRSIIHRMAHLDRSVPANLTGPGLFGSPNPSSLSNPAGRWALLAHSALYSESEFECYITPIIILPGDSGFWMKGDDSKHYLTHNSIARSSQICIIDPSSSTPLWTPPPESTTDWDEAELADLPNSGVDSETLEDVEDTVARTIRNTPTSEIELKPSLLDPDLFDDRDRNDSSL